MLLYAKINISKKTLANAIWRMFVYNLVTCFLIKCLDFGKNNACRFSQAEHSPLMTNDLPFIWHRSPMY